MQMKVMILMISLPARARMLTQKIKSQKEKGSINKVPAIDNSTEIKF